MLYLVLHGYTQVYRYPPYQVITKIRHSATLVATLPPDLQRHARDSYAIALRVVFIMAACSTFLAYCARLPVRPSLIAVLPLTEQL